MELNQIIGYFLALLVGITLGLIGSGGSILSVPILVYIMHIEPVLATAYSLFIVGVTALVGGIQKAKQQLVDFKKVYVFGVPTIISVFITRLCIVPSIPEFIVISDSFQLKKSVIIMVVFAIAMIIASYKMIQPMVEKDSKIEKNNLFKIIIIGIAIGLLAGFIGAGGGFLIIPVLFFLMKTPIKMAVGTSLFIVSLQSLIGFMGDVSNKQIIDWQLLFIFTICSIIGIFIGNFLSKKIESEKLKTGFGWFILAMGVYIICKEILFS